MEGLLFGGVCYLEVSHYLLYREVLLFGGVTLEGLIAT